LWLILTIPIIVIEQLGVGQGMSRSKSLMKGNLGKGFVLFLLVFLMTIILTYGLLGLGVFVAARAGLSGDTAGAAIIQLFTLVGTVLVTPISSAAAILLYYDLRIRKEGFDLEQLAQRMEPVPVASPVAAEEGPVQQ
jgi:membrane-anchored glycerophosphoryl diester phosphodiesterase (GDPDase)